MTKPFYVEHDELHRDITDAKKNLDNFVSSEITMGDVADAILVLADVVLLGVKEFHRLRDVYERRTETHLPAP